MKLQSASRRELSRVTVGTLICDGIMIVGLFLLSQFEIGQFDFWRILLSAYCGSLVAIANFTILCLTVQSAVGMKNQRKMKAKFQLSYNLRMLFQAAWVVACFLSPQIHLVAGALPVLFPNVTIFYLNWKGKLFPKAEGGNPETSETSETSETPEE